MPLKIDLQTAPRLVGDIGHPDLTNWIAPGGGSTSLPVVQGEYHGLTARVYLFTCTAGGTIGTTTTITVTWIDTEGNSGTFNLGTDRPYVANQVLNLHLGMSILFTAGTLVATDTFTLSPVPRRIVDPEHRIVESVAEHAYVDLVGTGHVSRDVDIRTLDERIYRQERAVLRMPSFSVNGLEGDGQRALLDIVHGRHRAMCFENYDEATICMLRGAGLVPVVGRSALFARTGTGSYRDPDTGLWRIAAENVPRLSHGPQLDSWGTSDWNNRYQQPLEEDPMGRGIYISDTATNALDTFHAEKADDGTTDCHWTAGGGATVTFDPEVRGVLDPEGGWDRKFLRGTARVELKSPSTNYIVTPVAERFSVTGGWIYALQLWMLGRGNITVQVWTGVSVPDTLVVSSSFYLRTDRWKRIAPLPFTASGGATVGEIRILPQAGVSSDMAVFWISAVQVEQNIAQSGLIQRDNGVGGVRNGEQLTLRDRLPCEGSLSFWMRWPPDNHNAYMGIVKDSTGHFILERTGAPSERWQWWTINTGRSAAMEIVGYPTNIQWDCWIFVAMTWKWELLWPNNGGYDFNRLRKTFYVGDNVSLQQAGEEVVVAAERTDVVFGYPTFFPIGHGGGPEGDWKRIMDAAVAEIHMSSRVLTLAEIRAQWARVAERDHANLHRELAGRCFFVRTANERWLNPVSRDKLYADVQLEECDSFDDDLVVRR